MLIYSDLMNLFLKWVWCGGFSPQVWSWYRWLNTCLLYCYWHLFMLFFAYHMLSVMVDFMLLSDIYCFLFWVGRWYLLSTCVLYWPLLVCFLFVICGVQQTYCRLQLVRNSSQSSPHQNSGWAIVPSLGWIFFFTSWCLEVLAWTSCLVILAS